MDVVAPLSFPELVSKEENTLSLIPWEKEIKMTIKEACQGFAGKQLRVFIGPEGGWESQEVELAIRHGAIPVRPAPMLLRLETAGLAAAMLVLSECGVYS